MLKINIIVATSALALFLAGTAQARDVQINQRFAGASVDSVDPETGNVTSDGTIQLKGAPGSASARSHTELGDFGLPSAQCDGFDLEAPILEGSSVSTFKDLSQLYIFFTSGHVCFRFDGTSRSTAEGIAVGGTGRFEGATGTLSLEIHGFAVSPPAPGVTSQSGTVTGTISID